MATTTSRRITTGLIASVRSHSAIRPQSMISLIRRNHHLNLRLPSPIAPVSRRWLIEAVPEQVRSPWEGSDDDGGAHADVKKPGVCGYAITGNEIEGSSGDLVDGDQQKHVNTMEMVMWAAATAAFGVGNRVMYKLALVPLKQYPFFLAQLSTFGYVAVYYSILYFRYRAGTVTDEMLSVPKMPFLIAGVLQALAAAAGMAATGAAHSLKEAGVFWILLMVLSYLFQGADTVLKEVIFIDSQKRLKGASLDLFIVNSYGSAFQAICIALLLPFLSKLWGIPFNQLGSYLKDGAACFLNIGTMTKGCDGAPLLPMLFVIVNIGYNIALLRLLKISSAVVSSLASTVSVPIAVFLFTLPLPYLGVASSLPKGFMGGTMILVLGMLLYSWAPQGPEPSHTDSVIPSPPLT
ncbi:hypothetical protein Bca4012_024334 [Brassica carinata]